MSQFGALTMHHSEAVNKVFDNLHDLVYDIQDPERAWKVEAEFSNFPDITRDTGNGKFYPLKLIEAGVSEITYIALGEESYIFFGNPEQTMDKILGWRDANFSF